MNIFCLNISKLNSYMTSRNRSVYQSKAEYWSEFGNDDKAIRTYKKALEIDPNYDIPLVNLTNIYFDRKEYEQAIKVEPNGWFIPSSHVGLGKCYEQLEMYDEAIAHFQEARKIVRYCFCHIKHKKEWVEEIEYHLKKLGDLEKES